MRLAEKLLAYIHSAFDKSPDPFVAFRMQHTSAKFRHVISDFTLNGYDDDVLLFSVDLNDHTLFSLAEYLGAQTGCSIVYAAPKSELGRSATVLLDANLAQSDSNGDCFYAFTSLLWSYLDCVGESLRQAKAAVVAMLDQMSIPTADNEWLDEWGGYFGVSREFGEVDAVYANRIIVEVMRPRGNNKAIEQALLDRFGKASTVTDLVKWKDQGHVFNSAYTHNSAIKYDATNDPIYGLFDVVISYNLESGTDLLTYAGQVRQFIEQFRDAGTHMESLNLQSGVLMDTAPGVLAESYMLAGVASLSDAATAPSDTSLAVASALATLSDIATAGSDAAGLSVTYSTLFNSARLFDGKVNFAGGSVVAETL
jgi:hypothetical protein